MSSDARYKEPRERYLYEDREGGETRQYARADPRESSTTGRRRSPRRRESSRHRRRRESPIRSQPDDRTRNERAEDTYTYDSRGYGTLDEPSTANEHEEAYSSSYAGKTSYAPQQESYPPQPYAGGTTTYLLHNADTGTAYPVQDARVATTYPVNDLEGQMQTLSTADYYTQQTTTSSVPAAVGYYESPPHRATQVVPASADYGQPVVMLSTSNYQSTAPVSRYVKGTPGDSERLDKSYQVRKTDYKKFFRVGRVFSTLWTDASAVEDGYQSDKSFVSEIVYKDRVYCKVRRFVVVRESDISVSCLPVTTYGGVGHRARGICLQDHGFMHIKNPPRKVPGMLSKSLKLVLSRGAVNIKDPSLVNYGKVYVVETNVKVKDIGVLDAHSKAILLNYFQRVFRESNSSSADYEDRRSQQEQTVITPVGAATDDANVSSSYSAPSGYNTTSSVPSGYTAASFTATPSLYASYSHTGPSQYDSNPYPAHSQYTSSSYTTVQADPPVEGSMLPRQSPTSLGYGEAPISTPENNSISNYPQTADEFSKRRRPSYSPTRSQTRRYHSSTDRSSQTKSAESPRKPSKTTDIPKVEPEDNSKVKPEDSEKDNQGGAWSGTAAKAIVPILAGVGLGVMKNMAEKVLGSNVELDGKERPRELPPGGTGPVIHHLNEGNLFELVGSLIR